MIKWFKRKNKKGKPALESDTGIREDLVQDQEGPTQEEIIPDLTSIPPAESFHAEEMDERIDETEEEPSPPSADESAPGEGTDIPSLEPAVQEMEPEGEAEREEKRYFKRLRERLHKTREQFSDRMDRLVLGRKTIDLDLLDELEEVLITSDLGVHTTQLLLQKVTEKIKRKELKDPQKLRDQLREEISGILSRTITPLDFRADHPFVVMVIGVNGVGKTTTIGKLAHQLKEQGLKVMLVAGDTFRAAAVEQLSLWGERAGVPVVKQKSGSDPSAVAFDAMDAAVSRDADVVLMDTAGRMHTKVNLMEELKKVQRTINKKMPAAPHEIFLVLDASTGQNALSQARLFKESIGLTGLILTKLDGTAKGGIVVAICDELQVPVRYIGIGEGMEDLRPFDAEEFARALF